ncbi:urease accessory protein UreD [Saccharothrix longispora]|uniref:urease accessory protein UreD n=1 Tax=Saccharothrix longispora TaxID=33920 RepID=UPI0028FD5D0F|nr:urease accessory protein UreD [Saccharothrix longispora]MBY8850653.1 urease accessory protein UreD [Saccharothrix sp. MB29]MDU0291573.1 urease accessory protein UreD [Saccharothrix longispora]
MRARARLVVERDEAGRSVVREMRSMAPLRLVPARGRGGVALVHLVSAVTSPLGGDDLELHVRVGPGAALELRGVAATLALPGHHPGGSRALVRVELGAGASLEHLPEPTVVTARANHEAVFRADLADDARVRTREIVAAGRLNERAGSLTTTLDVRRNGTVIRQTTRLGVSEVDASPAGLAGRRVLGTELLCWGRDLPAAVAGDWWSLVPLARGGSLATVLADDAVTALRALDDARRRHPGSAEDLLTRSRTRFRVESHS